MAGGYWKTVTGYDENGRRISRRVWVPATTSAPTSGATSVASEAARAAAVRAGAAAQMATAARLREQHRAAAVRAGAARQTATAARLRARYQSEGSAAKAEELRKIRAQRDTNIRNARSESYRRLQERTKTIIKQRTGDDSAQAASVRAGAARQTANADLLRERAQEADERRLQREQHNARLTTISSKSASLEAQRRLLLQKAGRGWGTGSSGKGRQAGSYKPPLAPMTKDDILSLEEVMKYDADKAESGGKFDKSTDRLLVIYNKYANDVYKRYEDSIISVNDAISKYDKTHKDSDLDKARALYDSYKKEKKEFDRMFGDGTNPLVDGAYNNTVREHGRIAAAQRDWWKRQLRASLQKTIDDALDRTDRDTDRYRDSVEMLGILDGTIKTRRVSDGFDPQTREALYRDATPEEEIAFREAEKIEKMEKMRAAYEAFKTREKVQMMREGYTEYKGRYVERIQMPAIVQAEETMKKYYATPENPEGFFDPKGPNDIHLFVDRMVDDWELKYPAPPARYRAGTRSGLDPLYLLERSQWEERRQRMEDGYYNFFGLGPQGILEKGLDTPGIKHALLILGTGFAAIGGVARAANAAIFHENTIGGVKPGTQDIPEVIRDQLRREAEAAVPPGGYRRESAVARKLQTLLTAWMASPEGQKWYNEEYQRRRVEDAQEGVQFAQDFYGHDPSKDWFQGFEALAAYGNSPFQNDAANLLAALLLDPLNAIPLNFLKYAQRGRFALNTAKGFTGAGGKLLGKTRPYKFLSTFRSVDEGTMALAKKADGLSAELVAGGHSVEEFTALLRERVLGVVGKAQKKSAIRGLFRELGLNPQKVNEAQIFSIAEHLIGVKAADRSRTIWSASDEAKRRIELAETERTMRAEARAKVVREGARKVKDEAARVKAEAEGARVTVGAAKAAEEERLTRIVAAEKAAAAERAVVAGGAAVPTSPARTADDFSREAAAAYRSGNHAEGVRLDAVAKKMRGGTDESGGAIKPNAPKPDAEYHGVPLRPLVQREGVEPIGAAYNKVEKTIYVDDVVLEGKYAEKAWTKPRDQPDGTHAEALPEDAFRSFEDFRAFALEHEYQHSILPRKAGETLGEYETRINRAALSGGSPSPAAREAHIASETRLADDARVPLSGADQNVLDVQSILDDIKSQVPKLDEGLPAPGSVTPVPAPKIEARPTPREAAARGSSPPADHTFEPDALSDYVVAKLVVELTGFRDFGAVAQRIAIVGSRGFADQALIDGLVARLRARYPRVTFVSGGAAGADSLGEAAAKNAGSSTIIHKPDWDKDGKSAGFKRDELIVRDSDAVFAFFAPGPRSRGTSHTVDIATKKGKPVHVYHEGKWDGIAPRDANDIAHDALATDRALEAVAEAERVRRLARLTAPIRSAARETIKKKIGSLINRLADGGWVGATPELLKQLDDLAEALAKDPELAGALKTLRDQAGTIVLSERLMLARIATGPGPSSVSRKTVSRRERARSPQGVRAREDSARAAEADLDARTAAGEFDKKKRPARPIVMTASDGRMPKNAVYIGRPGRGEGGYFGNPFPEDAKPVAERISRYEKYARDRAARDPEFRQRVVELRGKTLWCPQPRKGEWCHGQVLARLSDEWAEPAAVAPPAPAVAAAVAPPAPKAPPAPATAAAEAKAATDPIDDFHSAEGKFLSNFHSAKVEFDGKIYPTAEHAYAASKSSDPVYQEAVRVALGPARAKELGSRLERGQFSYLTKDGVRITPALREGWKTGPNVRLDFMDRILRVKFAIPDLRAKLLATGERELVEGNRWGDQFWGVSGGAGENHLGKILMKIRRDIRREMDAAAAEAKAAPAPPVAAPSALPSMDEFMEAFEGALKSEVAAKAVPPLETAPLSMAEIILARIFKMSEPEWYAYRKEALHGVLKLKGASDARKALARKEIATIELAEKALEIEKARGTHISWHDRAKFQAGVLKSHWKDAKGRIAPKMIAPLVLKASDITVEQARIFYKAIRRASPKVEPSGISLRVGGKEVDHLPLGVFKELDKRMSAAISDARGHHADTLTKSRRASGELEDKTRPLGSMTDEDPLVIAAKERVLKEYFRETGDAIPMAAYDEARMVLWKGHTQSMTAERLLDEAERIVARYGGDLEEVYLALRQKWADQEARRQLGGLAFGEMYGFDHEVVWGEFLARYTDDGAIRQFVPELTSFQMRTLEEAFLSLSGHTFDDAATPGFLQSVNAPPFKLGQGKTREFLRRIGVWSPRTTEDFITGKKSWSVFDEEAHWLAEYGEAPPWTTVKQLEGEFNDIFDDQQLYIEFHKQQGVFSRSNELALRVDGIDSRRLEEAHFKGDEELHLKARRSLEEQRRYAIERFGRLVSKDGATLDRMPWLMHPDELRRYMTKTTAKRMPKGFIRNAKDLADVEVLIDIVMDRFWKKYMENGVDDTAPILQEDVFRLASEIQARLIADPRWNRRVVDVFGSGLDAWAEFNRWLVFSNPSFMIMNVVDAPLKTMWYKFSRRGLFQRTLDNAKYADDANALTLEMLGENSVPAYYREAHKPVVARLRDPRGYTRVERFVDSIFTVARGTGAIFPSVAGKAEGKMKLHLAKGMWPQVYDTMLKKLKDPDLARAASLDFVKEQIAKMWPTAGSGPIEQLWNRFSPFASYSLRNKVLWISEAIDHPVILSQFDRIGRFIEEENVKNWEADPAHKGQPMPENLRRLIQLPWAKDFFIDLAQFTDASRGLKPLYDTNWKPSLERFTEWFRVVNPSMMAGFRAVVNAFGLLQRTGWQRVLDANDFPTGEWREVQVPWTEPWSQEEATLGSMLWFVDAIETGKKYGIDGWDQGEASAMAGQVFLFNAIKTYDKMSVTFGWYKGLSKADKLEFQKTPEGVKLQEWLREKMLRPKGYNPTLIEMIQKHDEDPFAWWHSQPVEYRARVAEARDKIKLIRDTFAANMYALQPGTDEWRQMKARMYLAISDVYTQYPELLSSEVYSKSASEWAKQTADWQTDLLADGYIELSKKRPQRAEYKTTALYNQAVDDWEHAKRVYLNTYPQVARQLAGEIASVEAVRGQIERQWDAVLSRISKRTDAIIRAKAIIEEHGRGSKKGKRAQARMDLLYLQNELDYTLLERDYSASYLTADDIKRTFGSFSAKTGLVRRTQIFLDFDATIYQKHLKAGTLEDYLAKAQYGRSMRDATLYAKGGDPFGEFKVAKWLKWMNDHPKVLEKYFGNNPGARDAWAKAAWYVEGLRAIWAKAGDDPGKFVRLLKQNPALLREYFKRNEGKEAEWARMDRYIRAISVWGKLVGAERWDEANDAWDNLPKWVQDEYYKRHPERRKRAQQTAQYLGFMAKWVKLVGEDEAKGMEYFRSLPKWAQDRYFENHPENRLKFEGNEEMIRLIAGYFATDNSLRGEYLQKNPQMQEWLTKNGGGVKAERLAILQAYKAIPKEDQWLRRLYREKYPEIFSAETKGEQKLASIYKTLQKHPGITSDFEKWVQKTWETYAEMLRLGAPRPAKPYFQRDIEGEALARKRKASRSAAEVSAS